MQRKERKLDGKRQKEGAEQPELGLGSKLRSQQFLQPEGNHAGLLGMNKVQSDDRQQHQQRTGHGEQEELDRRVELAAVTPDADQEEHRNQHDLPEQVEQCQVERQEDTHDARFHRQHQEQKQARFFSDRPP